MGGGEPVGPGLDGARAAAAVQQQHGTPAPSLGGGEVEVADAWDPQVVSAHISNLRSAS
ncbi:hypothetical protein GCM10028814_00300 [Angustibacter aerolatus]